MAKEINKKELTKEQMEKAMACKTADELMALAKAEGYELTKEEAEAFLAEVSEVELSDEVLGKAAGGYRHHLGRCPTQCWGFSISEPGALAQQNCPTYCAGDMYGGVGGGFYV